MTDRARLRHVRAFIVSAFAALAIGIPITGALHAQAPAYNGFRPYHGYYDTTFFMGAHLIFFPDLAVDSLHFSFSQFYHDRTDLRFYFDSARWDKSDPDNLWNLRRVNTFFSAAYRRGLKVVYEPNDISNFAWTTRNMEAYVGKQTFQDPNRPDSVHAYEFVSKNNGPHDSIYNHHYWGITTSASSTGHALVAQGARGTRMALSIPAPEARYWHRLKKNGVPYADSSEFFDLGLTLKADSIPPLMDSNTVLAYALLYRRETAGQPGPNNCRCNFYSFMDSTPITLKTYMASDLDPNPRYPYREHQHTFKFSSWSKMVLKDLVIYDTAYKKIIDRIDTIAGDPPRYDTTFHWAIDTTTRFTALRDSQVVTSYLPVNGAWFDWGAGSDTSVAAGRYCKRLLDSLIRRGILPARTINKDMTVEEGDFHYDVHSTRRVPITFLRGRVGPHTTSLLRRGELDQFIHAEIDSIYAPTDSMFPVKNPTDSLLLRVGITGENQLPSYYSEKLISSKVQRRMLFKRATETRGVWNNPIGDHASYRIQMGDLDSTDIRMMHMQATQAYHINFAAPVFYTDPAKMSEQANNSYYRLNQPDVIPKPGDTARPRLVMGASAGDHAFYTRMAQEAFRKHRGLMIDVVDVARRRYNYIRYAPYPVWNVVQVHGWFGSDQHGRYTGVFDNDWRPVTPEEIAAQTWQSLNYGMDGINFSDFGFCGLEFGVMHYASGDRDSEYDTLNAGKPSVINDPAKTVPKMWVGFRSRFNAVKRVTEDLHRNIIPVYRKLDRNGIHMAIHERGSFDRMPLLQTVHAEQADQFDTLVKPFKATGRYDSDSTTYMEVTHFLPGKYLAPMEAPGTRFLLFTNLRTWPIDFKTYDDSTRRLFDRLSADTSSFRINGLGNIDVRRPVVVFKGTDVLADSFRVQRLGDTVWRTFANGDTVRLDWLTPGWGAMYRVVPVFAPVSALGTAYNNAVHGENPSTNGTAKDRLIVYERDSVIYLRAMDSAGRWSKEYMISSTADSIRSVIVSGRRRNRADNMQPAIATVRNGTSCLVVWERQSNINGLATVEMAWLPTLPTRTTFPDSKTIIRRTLSAPRAFSQTWMRLTPSVVGVDSGYIVAWAAPDYTTEIKAVRDKLGNGRYDTSRVLRLKDPGILPNLPKDSATGYPTLAYVRNWTTIPLNGGTISGPNDTTEWIAMPPHVNGVPDTTGTYHVAHLAYQQGTRNAPNLWEIMYNKLGVRFPPLPLSASAGVPELWASETEDVSVNLQGCNFMHPSIAADSIRVGVAFTRQWSRDNIVLRFRDMDTLTPRLIRWNTTAYQWGGADFRAGRFAFPTGFKDYTRASLTLFPSRDSATLANSYEGALTWRWTNAPDGRRHGTKLYRFGKLGIDTLPDGEHPSMILVPYIGATAARAMSATGIFRRGNDASAFELRRGWGDTGVYYTAFLDNTPASPLEMFTQSPPSDTIFSSFDIRNNSGWAGQFGCTMAGGGIGGGVILGRPRGYPPPPPPPPPPVVPPAKEWGVPPTFFPPGIRGPKALGSLLDASGITRTGAFTADSTTVTLTRVLMGNDSLIAWLNTQPYDANAGRPANIFFAMQLVRQSDSAVLWSGDTVSARAVGNDTLEEAVTVPVNTAATPGTVVYIRLMAATTPGLSYRLSGGFHFLQDGVGGTGAKRVRQAKPQEGTEAESAIGVEMVPNPLRNTEGELRIRTTATGQATVTVFDLLGRPLLTVPPFTAESAGDYVVPVDLRALGNGAYLVRVEIGRNRGVTQFSIMR